MASLVQAGLFLIGVGIGTAITSVIAIPEALNPIRHILWFILIIIGVALIIKAHN